MYSLDLRIIEEMLPALMRGVMVTVELAVLSSLLGALLGALLAWPLIQLGWARHIGLFVVDIIRAIPNLVMMFVLYYFPYQALLGIAPISAFSAALWSLTIVQAAYSAELLRSLHGQLPQLQLQGLRSLGLTPQQLTFSYVIPTLIRLALPAHVAMWIGNIKLSSLASIIGVQDAVFVAKIAAAQSFRFGEAWLVVSLVYIALILPLTLFHRRIEVQPTMIVT